MQILLRVFIAMLVASLGTGILGTALGLSPHSLTPLLIGLPLWALCYWIFGHNGLHPLP